MKRILVVDDNADLLQLFTLVFTANNYQVKTTAVKKEVFELIQSFQPQVILIDVFLKNGVDGREVCREIKTTHSHIPVILMSANTKLLLNHTECQADDVAEKAFDLIDLLNKVKGINKSNMMR